MRDRAVNTTARNKVLAATLLGCLVGGVSALFDVGRAAPLIGWDVAALVFCVWTYLAVWPMDATATASHSQRENPSRATADVVLVSAAVTSLAAVGLVLFGAAHAPGNVRYLEAAFALASVFISWTVVHTVFTLKYAVLYYSNKRGGINFNEPDAPQYSDFAYLSYTIGMTFQVSDTNIEDKVIRRAALRHAWISYPFGAVIIATSINLVSGLAK